jgi:CDP-diacylglycerol pyrophosphatase
MHRLLFAAAAAALLLASGRAEADPDALWKIVHGKCVPDQEQHADPAPCALVDLQGGAERGYVVLKDTVGKTQYLLIPTARRIGIEAPALLQPDAPNYFAAAWRQRGFVERAAGRTLPSTALGLAINSIFARSQDQLHIHIDCVKPDVAAALRRQLSTIGDQWAPLAEPIVGKPYRAMRVRARELDGVDPFKLLADGVPGAAAAMALETLAIVGVEFEDGQPGFVILNTRADPAHGNRGDGEGVLDHSCAVARE